MTWRLRVTFSILLILFSLVIMRLYHWQVIKAEELSLLGTSQYGRFRKIEPVRGEIKTSDGFSIATNKISYRIFANPKNIKNKKETSILLSSLLSEDEASISALLSKDLLWVSIKSKVDNIKKKEIENLKLEGVGFEQYHTRFYPEASMAAQVLGIVGKNENGEDKGYFGLEGYYERQLRGKPGIGVQIHDALGRPILSKLNEGAKAIDGRSLVLSIDRVLQFFVEKKLKEGVEKYQAKGGMIGIMDPNTGNILAMASYPSFDPRKYQEYSDDLYKNPFITNSYEPGSTFKPLILASALDLNKVKADTKCTICNGPVTIEDYQIKTWNDKYFKDTTMVDVIQHSDNTGMVFIAKSLGLQNMISYFQKFNIGNTSGIDLQGETAIPIKQQELWYPIDLATASFGQGISITPLQLLVAFSSLANGGKIMEPHVVSYIETPDGQKISIPQKVLGNPISQKTSKVMKEILVNAVDKGEAKFFKPKGYRIAGKTGTAQIPIAGHYDPNKTIASFIGFAPADNPKFVMLVIIDQPTTSIYGSETAAPIFFSIAKDIFAHYSIPPTE